MFQHRFDDSSSNLVALHWFLLSFNGGCINAGGFLATGRFVSHVTGFATLFGVDLMENRLQSALAILSVPIFFLMGAFIAGLLVERPAYLGRKPHYDWVMGLCALCLFLPVIGATSKFGSFGGEFELKRSYSLLALLCLASGLQNAAISYSSGKSVRTTHLTGLTTDLGLGLARFITKENPNLKGELRANYLRAGSIAAFVLGSAVGASTFIKLGFFGFALPGLIATYAAWHGRKAKWSSQGTF